MPCADAHIQQKRCQLAKSTRTTAHEKKAIRAADPRVDAKEWSEAVAAPFHLRNSRMLRIQQLNPLPA
jgi:hypothetical protein